MKATVLAEPELEFGLGRHIDVKHGLAELGPLDRDGVREIGIGVVGSAATREAVSYWIEAAAAGVAAKASPLPNLFPAFPGFSEGSPFSSRIQIDERLSTEITTRSIAEVTASQDPARVAAELLRDEIRGVLEKGRPDVIVCAIPAEILEVTDKVDMETEVVSDGVEESSTEDDPGESANGRNTGLSRAGRTDLRDYLKAIALPVGVPLQLIRPESFGMRVRRPRTTHLGLPRSLQDEATRAWNFFVALYYKSSGTPWRLVREEADFSTCYVGVSFYRSTDESTLQTTMAQVFNERGQGMVIRGGPARQDKTNRIPHIDSAGAHSLLKSALAAYRAEHRALPARVVIHKSSFHDAGEVDGFTTAADEAGIEMLDLLSISGSAVRLMRTGAYPVLRGTWLSLDERDQLLYTRGSVPFFETYPGPYVPRPIRLRLDRAASPAGFLAAEALALTKMNWNNTQFDGATPITLRAAKEVGRVLRYVPSEAPIQGSYAFYM